MLGGITEDIVHYTGVLGVLASLALGTVFTSRVDFEDARGTKVRLLLIKEYLTFFERAWFRRLWISQEMMVPRITLMHCGSLLPTWDRLVNFVFVICYRGECAFYAFEGDVHTVSSAKRSTIFKEYNGNIILHSTISFILMAISRSIRVMSLFSMLITRRVVTNVDMVL